MRSSTRHRAAPTVCLGVLLALITGCGGQPAGDAANPSGPPIAAVLTTAQPGQVVAHVKTLVQRRAESPTPPASTMDDQRVGIAVPLATATGGAQAADAMPSSSRTGTTVQELGVDEDDLLKSDGRAIYALRRARWEGGKSRPDQLQRFALQPDGRPAEPVTLDLPTDPQTHTSLRGLLLAPDHGRLALLGESNSWFAPDCPPDALCAMPAMIVYSAPKTTLQWVRTEDSQLIREQGLVIDGSLVGARSIGQHLYVVIRHSPRLEADRLPRTASAAEREAALAGLTFAEVMPGLSVNGEPATPVLDETDCHLQTGNESVELQITVLLAFDMASGSSRPSGRCFVGGTEALYMSPTSLYLATSRYPAQTLGGRVIYSDEARTDLHKFAVDGAQIRYRGSGEIAGHLGWDPQRAAYRMSEYQGDLRILSFTGSTGWATLADASDGTKPPSPATLTVLRDDPAGGGRLQTVSTLPNARRPAALGQPGEQLYGVRFHGTQAWLVTFRQVDPLYALDLSDPLDPRVRGELKIPGYSDYLFPLADGLLLGVGKDATDQGLLGGVKVALFDVADPATPTERGNLRLGERGSASGLDHSPHGIQLAAAGDTVRIALPVLLNDGRTAVPTQGLQRISVDRTDRSLKAGALLASPGDGWAELSSDRALLIGDRLYYWSHGQLLMQAW
jgi:hypothetical protein